MKMDFEGVIFKVHREIIARESLVWASFTEDCLDPTGTLVLTDDDPEAARLCLAIMYSNYVCTDNSWWRSIETGLARNIHAVEVFVDKYDLGGAVAHLVQSRCNRSVRLRVRTLSGDFR